MLSWSVIRFFFLKLNIAFMINFCSFSVELNVSAANMLPTKTGVLWIQTFMPKMIRTCCSSHKKETITDGWKFIKTWEFLFFSFSIYSEISCRPICLCTAINLIWPSSIFRLVKNYCVYSSLYQFARYFLRFIKGLDRVF